MKSHKSPNLIEQLAGVYGGGRDRFKGNRWWKRYNSRQNRRLFKVLGEDAPKKQRFGGYG